MPITLDQLNAAPPSEGLQMLDGLYEHSPWIAERALEQRPFASLAQLKHAMVRVLDEAGIKPQLALIRAHPELAGKAMVRQTLTAESSHEQAQAGLGHCTPTEFARIQQLNADYHTRFGFPFILAVRGPRGSGLSRLQIIEAFERRLHNPVDFERQECLRNIHRIAELRLNDIFGEEPVHGQRVWDWQQELAQHSDPGYAEKGQLTVTYLSDAHRACAQHISRRMKDCGFDEVEIDAVGNVVGRYHPAAEGEGFAAGPPQGEARAVGDQPPAQRRRAGAKYLLTGSHYDTVRNGGKYDGRLGICVPMVCVQQLHIAGKRLPFGIEVVGFSEEEGQRYKATFLGASALTGQFDLAWLEQQDANGVTMRQAMQQAGLCTDDIPTLRRDPAQYLGFIEVHIEQGPVLNELNLPLGIVTSINGSVRYLGEVTGMASHAGTTPMDRRRDAAAGVAELILYAEQRAAQDGDSVATVGMLQVPNGSINVVPGACTFSLDLRAPSNAQRDAIVQDVLTTFKHICERRGLRYTLEQTMRAAAAPSAADWQARWERAVTALGVPLHRMPSGAGHDAMKLHEVMPQAMLFVRGENNGISHNPLESSTAEDIDLAVRAFDQLLQQLTAEYARS